MDSLVSTEWLAGQAGAADLVIVDASYQLPHTGRDAAAEHAAGHIPGAVFLNLGGFADPDAAAENTMPKPDVAAAALGRLGIGDDSRVVLYDDAGGGTAPRAWYMLRLLGARHLAILDGGLAKWKSEGRPLAQGNEALPPRGFSPSPGAGSLRTKDDMRANITSQAEQVLDARSAGRFTGTDPEPRAGLTSGHIPGSRSLPFARLYGADGTLKDKAELRTLFEGAGIDLERPITTSCGSGVTACALAFALHRLGKEDVSVYDGSWSEWASDPATPKATGPA